MRKNPELQDWIRTVLAISIVYRGCGIPIAWKVVAATSKGAWKPYWQELFAHVQGSVPPDWFVIVTTDRGLYADWLYKQIQSNGWHHTKITDPKRAERHWLAIALATLWVISVGGEADVTVAASSLTDLPDTPVGQHHSPHTSPTRWLSCFRRGVLFILSALLNRQELPLGNFFPDDWPSSLSFSTPSLDLSSA